MVLDRFIAAQLARPSGPVGRWLMGAQLNRLNAAMNRLVYEELQPFRGEILEVGFGGGKLVEELVANGAKVAAADISIAMTRRLSKRLAPRIRSRQLEVVIAAADAMPFESNRFAKACSVNTIYFWSDLTAALTEIRRVLQPDGAILLCYNQADELRKWRGHRHGFRLYETGEVERSLAGTGFIDIRTISASDSRQGLFLCTRGTKPGWPDHQRSSGND